MSSHGEMRASGAYKSAESKISSDTIRWVHVVPHFDGVEMMMSPSRSASASHLALF
ncbi:MAG TPA: hypothetical protein VHD87_09370 [Acidimicrobiales bacterium]|nr:hypothetical protein [Acidimicrobiales bacterium]